MINKIKRSLAVLRFGLLTLRYTGLRFTLQKLLHQLYSRTIFLGTLGALDTSGTYPDSNCVVTPASPKDFYEFFQQIAHESKEGKYDLLVRRWFYEQGFRNCYIGRTIDTNEPCNIRWVLTFKNIQTAGFEHRYPRLNDDEIITENVYTPERFRRRGFQNDSIRQLYSILWKQGYRWDKGYIAEDNIINLISNKKRGKLVFEKVLERHLLFRVNRKTIESYNPPIPIEIPKSTEPNIQEPVEDA